MKIFILQTTTTIYKKVKSITFFIIKENKHVFKIIAIIPIILLDSL